MSGLILQTAFALFLCFSHHYSCSKLTQNKNTIFAFHIVPKTDRSARLLETTFPQIFI